MAIQTWNAAWNADPTGGDQLSQGDNEILDTRNTVRAELKVEHDVGDDTVDANYTDTGRHKSGSARSFFQAAAPTTLLDATAAGSWPPVAPETDKLGFSTLDNGRLWVDFDDCQPYVREQEITGANWTDQNTNYTPAGSAAWLSLWPCSWTDVHAATVDNERPGAPTNDTRDTITGMAAQSIDIPDDGRSYELVVRAVITYQLDAAGHGAFWLEETAPGASDRAMAFVTNIGAQENSGTIILEYLVSAPANGATYTFDVDFASSVAASFYANPTEAVINGGPGGIYVAGAGGPNRSKLYYIIRPRYDTTRY